MNIVHQAAYRCYCAWIPFSVYKLSSSSSYIYICMQMQIYYNPTPTLCLRKIDWERVRERERESYRTRLTVELILHTSTSLSFMSPLWIFLCFFSHPHIFTNHLSSKLHHSFYSPTHLNTCMPFPTSFEIYFLFFSFGCQHPSSEDVNILRASEW